MNICLRLSISVLFLIGAAFDSHGQVTTEDLPNSFTYTSPVPQGCLLVTQSKFAIPEEADLSFDGEFTKFFGGFSATYRVRTWRIGCHEPNRSVIAINFSLVSGDSQVPYPYTRLIDPDTAEEHPAGLHVNGRESRYEGAWNGQEQALTIFPSFPDGATFVLIPSTLAPEEYNQEWFLELEWEDNSKDLLPIFSYEPTIDPPQLASAAFHGRYSGQWVVDGLPASGLLLQIGEVPGTMRNFIFAIWFTYIDGAPTWVVGNTDFEIGSNEIAIDMNFIEGGEFFTQPGSFTQDDIAATPVGTMTVRANHCNEIEADIDFTSSGLGAENLTFNRLIRIAGYDCDQTQ